MSRLHQIQTEIEQRVSEISRTHGNWPCHKGCDDCCRSLASPPFITCDEWQRLAAAIDALPSSAAVRRRIRESAGQSRPVTCPLLDLVTGTCLVYDARPLACRAYGFYAARHEVLGCHRIEAVASQSPNIIWGNHNALEDESRRLGPAAELAEWLHGRR